jgi:hypothetical protein
VLIFFPVVGVGDSPNPSPEGECAPSSFGSGGGAHTLARRGREGESPFRRGDIHCGTLYYKYVLFGTNLRTIRERKYMSMLESSASNMMGCQVLNKSVKLYSYHRKMAPEHISEIIVSVERLHGP